MASLIYLVETYGLVVVAILVALESICLPVPGETVLILAAVFAGTQHHLNIVAIVLTASAAAIAGQAIGLMPSGANSAIDCRCAMAVICGSLKGGLSLASTCSCATALRS